MKKKTIPTPILIEIVIIVVLVVAILVVFLGKASKNTGTADSEIQTEETVKPEAVVSPSPTVEPTSTPASEVSAGTYSYTAGDNSSVQTVIGFPYQDTVSGIVISFVDSYDGAFLEDSSDEQVHGVAVLVIQNQSSGDIELAQITLKQGNAAYHFEVSALPQGATAVVQEKDRKALPDGSFNTCTVVASTPDVLTMSADSVSVEETEDGALKVTNLTGDTIPCVRVFYKYYSDEDGVYVGGITYTAKITDLEGGQEISISPSHYVSGYSQVVMVRTYDTAED